MFRSFAEDELFGTPDGFKKDLDYILELAQEALAVELKMVMEQ